MLKVGIAGVTGYTGVYLLRLLLNHPHVKVAYLFSSSRAGTAIGDLFPQFAHECHLTLSQYDPANMPQDMDVLFLAVPHGQTQNEVPQIAAANQNLKIIDLSADFRIQDPALYADYYSTHSAPDYIKSAVYGVPEINRDAIKAANIVANPGCYAIASVLGLWPIKHLITPDIPVTIDAKSGVSGAGRSLKATSLYCEANEAISAYGLGRHRHIAEIIQEIGEIKVSFFPHLSPQNTGILAGIYLPNKPQLSQSDLTALYNNAYHDHPFTVINDGLKTPSTKYVVGSNNCLITPTVTQDGNTIAIFSAIDNLLKGASGQAVQNMNLMCGFDEGEGLPGVARYV